MTDYITEVKTAWEIIQSCEDKEGNFVEFNIRINLLQRTSNYVDDIVVTISQGKTDASIGLYPKNIDLNKNQCHQMIDILNLALDKTKEN